MKSFWKHEHGVQAFLVGVNDEIRTAVEPASPYIRPQLLQMVENCGKMLRPAMIYIASLLGEHQDESLVKSLAAAMEMLHMASLVHDDVIDNSSVRRGSATLQHQAGVKQAVIAGDYLLTRAFTELTQQVDGLNADIVRNSLIRLCDSEIDQDSELWNFSIGVHRYVRRIAGKTAALFSLSLYLGGVAAGLDDSLKMRLRRIGYEIGMFFQIQDDILDYTGTTSDMGKAPGSDLRCGLATLPLIYALQRDTDGHVHRLLRGKKKLSARAAGRIAKEVREHGGVAAARQKGQEYIARAVRDIELLGNNETARLLKNILDRLNKRAA